MPAYRYLLHGSANIEYVQEGEKGLIATPVDVHKPCSQMFMFIDPPAPASRERPGCANSVFVMMQVFVASAMTMNK